MTSHKTPRRRVKRRRDIRWLRSNGTPNFSDHIHRVPGDLELIAKKPVATVSPNSPLIKALEIMSSNYRSLVVTQKDYVKGLLLATHMINYLGGGEYFNIVVKRHGYNIFSALEKEPVESIMEREPIIAYTSDKLPDVLEKMVIYNIGVLPVVDEDERIYGILTEHDLVKYLAGILKIGVEVSRVMSSPVITIDRKASLKQAMEKMISFGFRRLPVVEDDVVIGIITAMDIIKYFNPHTLFKDLTTTDIREILDQDVEYIMERKLLTVKPDSDLGVVVNEMTNRGVGSALVVDDNMVLKGIVTERDILYALTVREIK